VVQKRRHWFICRDVTGREVRMMVSARDGELMFRSIDVVAAAQWSVALRVGVVELASRGVRGRG